MSIKNEYKNALSQSTMFITIDIGGRKDAGTACALFSRENKIPTMTKTFFSSIASWDQRVNYICLTCKSFFKLIDRPCLVFTEKPEFWETHKGMTAAKTESLFKLIYIYGRLHEVLISLGYTPVGILAKEWKGQLPKKIMKNRVERITGKKYTEDEADAVGIGLYLKGLL